MEWLVNNSKQLPGKFGGITGVDHYYTNQGMPCVHGKPQEFALQDALATRWKGIFPTMRFLSYRILSAVPYDMLVENKMVSDPDFFVRWQHEPNAATKAAQKCPADGCQAGSICFNYLSSCFNDPNRINSPRNNCSFPIRAAAYNFAKPLVRDWFVKNIIAPTLTVADGAWLDGNGPDNGAYMCAGICCGFNSSNSPHSTQTQVDDFCAGELETAIASHKYLIENGGYEYNCMTFLEHNLPGAGQGVANCSANLKSLARQQNNMTVVYGGRTGPSGYNDSTISGAVAAFLLARQKHWLFHMPRTLSANTAKLVLSDFGPPQGLMHEAKPGVWVREYEKATVSLDCSTFSAGFSLKSDYSGR